MDLPQLFAFKWVPVQGTLLFRILFTRVDCALKLFASELVQEDVQHQCLQAWQPHQSERDETFCYLCCYHFTVTDCSLRCGFRRSSCAFGPAASRAARGWIRAHGWSWEAADLEGSLKPSLLCLIKSTLEPILLLHHPLSCRTYPAWLCLTEQLFPHKHTASTQVRGQGSSRSRKTLL